MKRIFYLSLLLCALAPCTLLLAQPLNNWTADMPSSKIPTGVTLSVIDTLDWDVVKRFSVDLDATTYDNATQATAFNAIGEATKTAILNTWLASQAIDTADIDVLGVILKNVNRQWDTFEHPDPLLQYQVAEDIYRVTGLVKYTVE